MIVTTIKKSERKPAASFVHLSRMDYELVCNVLLLLEETGMDDEELSFLLGKRNQYFFELIDPRKKQKLKTDQVDPLAPIFGKLHHQIIPLDVAPGEMVQLHHATRTVEDSEKSKTVTYSHIVYPEEGGDGKKIIWQKKSVKGERYKIKSEVLSFLKAKVSAGYFSKPRLALPLYLEMKRTLEPESFSAMDVERALAKLLRSKGELMSDSIDTQEHYFERHEIFMVQPADVSRLVEIWEASVRATHHFLSEGDIRYFLPLVRDEYIPSLEVYGIRNLDGKIMGFMGLAEDKVEMLFIHPDDAGHGLGAFLILKAVKLKGKPLFVDVNEQNPTAIRFYQRIGFKSIGRSELDATGKPFPIIHMELPDSQTDNIGNVKLIKGDITTVEMDAIVNAANTSLLGGGGVDGAIHRAGGPAILEDCEHIRAKQGGCKVGEAVITTAGNLPAKYVIHTVGPVWNGGENNEEALLASAYKNSLALAMEHQVKSIAFPNISTGIYRFPKDRAAEIAVKTVKEFLDVTRADIEVTFVCFDEENYRIYEALLN